MSAEVIPINSDEEDYPVHPAAAVFPMLDANELAELADDILVNGLIHPIMLDALGEMLVDGRNRLAACRIAGVEPQYDCLAEGVEPVDYIASVNLARRHMSAGQRAMAMAMLHPTTKQGKRGTSSATKEVSGARLSLARTVLRIAPDEAHLVLSGAKSLDAAFIEAQRRQNAAEGESAKLEKLKTEAPDLAVLVTEGRMSLSEGVAALDQRNADQQRIIDTGRRAADRLLDFCNIVVSIAGAAEHGERGLVNAVKLAQLDDAMTLLRRVYRIELDEWEGRS